MGFYSEDAFKSSKDMTWNTPQDLFDKLDAEFHFTLDAAALQNSAKCKDWFGPDHSDEARRDAFENKWEGVVFLNPPYGRTIGKWMAKAAKEARGGAIVVCLIPSRTDTKWWHDYCITHEVRFIKGRIKFVLEDKPMQPAPFPSAVVVMK